MKELNENLARWAGLQQIASPNEDLYGKGIWADSLGIKFDTPNFTESLDACFKWLMPVCHHKLGNVKIESGYRSKDNPHWMYTASVGGGRGKSKAKTPALALCKAIEQLMDSAHE